MGDASDKDGPRSGYGLRRAKVGTHQAQVHITSDHRYIVLSDETKSMAFPIELAHMVSTMVGNAADEALGPKDVKRP